MADSLYRINRGITLNPQAAAPAGPTNGDLYYDSALKTFAFYDNGFWINLASRVDVAGATDLTSAQFTAAVVQNSLIRITGTTATNIDGLTASTGGKQVVIYNQSTNTVTIKNQSGTEGTAANRITTPSAADITLNAGQTIVLVYDDAAATWVSASSPGSGSGSGSGSEKDLNDLLFRAAFDDEFTESTTNAGSAVDAGAAKTNAVFSANGGVKPTGGGYFTISYDASKTVSGSTVNMTMSGAPTFTVVAGDVLIVSGEARKIVTVTSQTVYVIESAFTVTPSPSVTASTVSQCVHTKDIYNITLGDNAIATAFPGTTFSEIMVDYEDAPGASTVSDLDIAPVIGYTASQNGTAFTGVNLRPTLETDTLNSVMLPAAGSGLFLRFFANKSSGSGSVDLLRYEAWMQKLTASAGAGGAGGTGASGAYGVFSAAYGFTNGVGTPVNMSVSLVSGKTTITLLNGFTYAVGVSPGSPYGSLDVYLNGQLLPRFINSTLTPDGSYLETSPTVLTLDRDYSTLNLAVEVLQRTSVVDTSIANISSISFIQEIERQGFQSFVNTANLITSTTTTGSPAAGSFYSTIVGRAPIVDLSQDLKPRMGIERIPVQQAYLLQNEFGPNGEPVYGALNDSLGQIRFVGAGIVPSTFNTSGQYVNMNAQNDYVEITFYGTGLNWTVNTDNANSALASTDGGSEGANVYAPSTAQLILQSRNYSPNQVLPVVSGLSLGIHTVKIRRSTNVGSFVAVTGFEILNESSSIKVTPGSSYVGGQKLTSTALASFLYNASPVTGTRGGRVLVYQASDSSISKAFQVVNASQANLTSADHTNEEVVRSYHIREFGAARSDDFSRETANSSGNWAFVLEDGTTTLEGNSVSVFNETLNTAATGSSWSFTFVGTGVDWFEVANATLDSHTITVDNTSIGSISGANVTGYRKIVSGLPYGTHILRVTRPSATLASLLVRKLIVYQPKKPALPTGAVELADYNVMANYVGSAAGFGPISTGILRKPCTRESTYIGTGWTFNSYISEWGFTLKTPTNGDSVRYAFFGTGVEIIADAPSVANNATVKIDGVNYTGAATVVGGGSWTPGTSTWSVTAGINAARLEITGLTLGLHTVELVKASATDAIAFYSWDIITPIHSVKSNLLADIQNSLPVGSNAISDNRQITPVKNVLPATKVWVQALGSTISSPTTTSTSFVPMPDMSVVLTKKVAGPVKIGYSVDVLNQTAANGIFTILFINGLQFGNQRHVESNTSGFLAFMSDELIANLGVGTHKIDVYWAAPAGTTVRAQGFERTLHAEEL